MISFSPSMTCATSSSETVELRALLRQADVRKSREPLVESFLDGLAAVRETVFRHQPVDRAERVLVARDGRSFCQCKPLLSIDNYQ